MTQGNVAYLFLARGSFWPNFFEPVGDYDQGVHPLVSALIGHLRNHFGWHSNNSHVDIAWNSKYRMIGLQRHERISIGIHRIYLARKATLNQTLEKEIANRARMSGCANQCYGLRLQEPAERRKC